MLTQNLNLNAVQNFAGIPFQYTIRSVGDLITLLVPYVFWASGIALLIYLVLGGLQMMTSRGNPKEVETAQHKITNALLGFIIIFISYWVVQLIGKVLGIEAFSNIFI